MNILKAIKNALAFPAWGGTSIQRGGIADWVTWYGSQGHHTADAGPLHRNGVVMACAAWIMRAGPEPPLQVVKEDEDGEENEVPKHPLTLAFRQPNPFYGADCLWQRIHFDRALHGQAFLYKMRNGAGQIQSLWHVPQHRLIPQWDASGKEFISHYLFVIDAKQEPVPVADLVHFRFGGDPDRERLGVAPLGSALREIGALNEGANYRGEILRNMGVPSHLIQSKDPTRAIGTDAAAQLHALWAERVSGRNRGKPIIPNWPLEAIKIGMSPAELDLGSMNYENADLICALFGLSAMVVGMSSGSAHKTYCLPAGARVWTTAGGKRIVDVKPGEQVWSFTDGALVPCRVLRRWRTGYKRLFEVRTKNRTLRATDNHPVLVRVPGALGGATNDGRRVRYAWKTVGDLKPGDHVVQAKFLPDQEGTMLPDGREATPDLMQFFGALIGDGTVVGRAQTTAPRVEMSMPMADRCGGRYRELATALFVKHGGEAVSVYERPRSFCFCSTQTVEALEVFGLGGRASTKRVPGWIYQLTRPLRLAFLAGLVDSDGSIDKRGSLSFTFCNEALTNDVRELLISVGVQCGNIYHTNLPVGVLPSHGRLLFYQQWRFTASAAAQVAAIPFADPLYRERVEANPDRNKVDGFDARKTGMGAELGFYRVISIRELPAEDVYDLEVEGGHSFVADGVVVHNSNFSEARQAAVETCLVPAWKQLAQDLTLQLLPDYSDDPDECVEFDLSKVRALEEDEDALSTRLDAAVKAGRMTVNESRSRQNLPALEGKQYDTPMVVTGSGPVPWPDPDAEPPPPPGPLALPGGDHGAGIGQSAPPMPALTANGNGHAP